MRLVEFFENYKKTIILLAYFASGIIQIIRSSDLFLNIVKGLEIHLISTYQFPS